MPKELTHDDIRVLLDKPDVSLVEPVLEDIVIGRCATVLSLVHSWRHVPHQVDLQHTENNGITDMAWDV
jgi:hypothetical protein